MKEKLIAIFNANLSVGVFITPDNDGNLFYEFFNDFKKEKLSEFIAFLEKNKPKLREEINDLESGIISMGFREIDRNDPIFINAALDELKRRNLMAVLVDDQLREVLLLLSDKKVTISDREKLIGNLVNLGKDNAKDISKFIKDISSITFEIKKNREDWDKFLNQKREELLNNKP